MSDQIETTPADILDDLDHEASNMSRYPCGDVMEKAAAEIRRLRADLAMWRGYADTLSRALAEDE